MSLRNLSAAKRGGNYTPTLTGVTNIDTVTLNGAFYQISGNVVTVYLHCAIDATAAAAWEFRCSLPFAIDVQATQDIIGGGSVSGSGGFGAAVQGDPTNNEAAIDGQHDASELDGVFIFSYRTG